MKNDLRIALAQLNPVMGDIAGNLAKARNARAQAVDADIIVFSELFIVGYPPEDLVLKPAFQEDAQKAIEAFAKDTSDGGPAVLIGSPWLEGGALYNALLVLDDGKIVGMTFKHDLPNYGVFDEKRVFSAGPMPKPLDIRGVHIGVPICEDIWTKAVISALNQSGAEIFLVPNGSPFEAGKENTRQLVAKARAEETGKALIYLNQVGGQDELVFDGASFVVNPDASVACMLPPFQEKVVITHWKRIDGILTCEPGDVCAASTPLKSIYDAMVLGLRDYVDKNRFVGVVLGLSGGVDSALSAAVAVDALGQERVRCLMMPSRYTSTESLEDAQECSRLLGTAIETLSIEPAVAAFSKTLADTFSGLAEDVTEENIQSRVRAVILMAYSNKLGHMVLTTGNKSEMSVGYATLYGDMCGGFNVLKDVYKTDVFKLAQWRNENISSIGLGPTGRVIPQNILMRPPTAELRFNQLDQDSLPPYDILDGILKCLIEKDMSFKDVVAQGFDPATVKRIEHLIYVSEYKRRQAPPGIKITSRNFGRDRRYPITNAYRDAK